MMADDVGGEEEFLPVTKADNVSKSHRRFTRFCQLYTDKETGNNTQGFKPFPVMQLPYNLPE